MRILEFIFVLGINFSIFGFIWGIFQFIVRNLQNPNQQRGEVSTYILRIIKYFLLVSVTANFIVVNELGAYKDEMGVTHIETFSMVVGSIVMGLYLLGKLQNRTMMSQLGNNPMFSRLIPKIDPKVERYLLAGSLLYFVFCLWYPSMVNNGLINWFTEAIISIKEAFLIGWVFYIIAFFFLISILMRGANVIGNLLNGNSILEGPQVKSNFKFRAGGTKFGSNDEDNHTPYVDDEGFTTYEDVTEEDDNAN